MKKFHSFTDQEAAEHLANLQRHEKVLQMKGYIQHGRRSTFDHCESVARLSHRLNRRLHLGADEPTMLTGAMLHDFYLYDWHHKDNGTHDWHGFIHAGRAAENARKYLHVNSEVQDVIQSHMWPLNITRLPKSRAAWIVCLADKVISIQEIFSAH